MRPTHYLLPFAARLLLLLACTAGARAEDGDASPTHSAVTPAERGGGAHQRHLLLNDRVAAAKGAVDIVFVGDSITQGWEGAGKQVWDEFYGDRRALNLGIGGDRTQHVLWRLDHGNLEGIAPKVAVVMIGTNNSGSERNPAGEIVDGVTAVVDKLRASLPSCRILLLGIFPRGEAFNDQRGRILQVNQTLRRIYSRQGPGQPVRYLDFGHAFLTPEGRIPKGLMPDSLHLSEKGYRLWARHMEKPLAALLGEPDDGTPPDPSGTWAWTAPGPGEEDVEARLTLAVDEAGAVTGTFRFGERELAIEDGRWKEGELTLTVVRERPDGGSMTYRLSGTLNEQGALGGTARADIGGEEATIPWSARRSPAGEH